METYYQLRIEDLRSLAHDQNAFLEHKGWTTSQDALLTPDFIQEFLPRAELMPEWLGFLAFRDGMIVGSGGYRHAPQDGFVEIGYGIAPSFREQGCATRLARELTDYAFQFSEVDRVRAHTLADGIASQKALLKNGFQFVGIFEDPEDGAVNRYELTH